MAAGIVRKSRVAIQVHRRRPYRYRRRLVDQLVRLPRWRICSSVDAYTATSCARHDGLIELAFLVANEFARADPVDTRRCPARVFRPATSRDRHAAS